MAGPYDKDQGYSPVNPYDFEQVTVSTTAIALTAAKAASAARAVVTVETASIRYRTDSNVQSGALNAAPTASVGMLANAGDQIVLWGTEIQRVKFIRASGVDALIDVEYGR